MKRALAERAKQSGLPNGVAASPADPTYVMSMSMGSSGSISGGVGENGSSSSPAAQPLKMARTTESPPPGLQLQHVPSAPAATAVTVVSSSTTLDATATTAAPPAVLLSTASSSSPRTMSRGTKRQRDVSNAPAPPTFSEDEDDSNFSSFYLRHQNRAMASELSRMKYQLAHLERERDYRRRQCQKACQSVNSLQATWTQLETSLQPPHAQSNAQSNANLPTGTTASGIVLGSSSSLSLLSTTAAVDIPVSTGFGTSVELVGSLLDSLAALGKRKQQRRHDHPDQDNNGGNVSDEDSDDDDEDDMEEDDQQHQQEKDCNQGASLTLEGAQKQQLDDLLRVTENVAQRATTLQQWIWGLLEKVEHGGDNTATFTTSSSSSNNNSAFVISKLSKKVARLQAKTKLQRAELQEVSRARDEMNDSDKRVRRGLYRLAAGRVQLKEVLKAIERSDTDKEAAAAWMEAVPMVGSNTNPSKPVPSQMVSSMQQNPLPDATESSSSQQHQLRAVDSAQVAHLQKQLTDIEQIAKTRDEQIQKVRKKRAFLSLWILFWIFLSRLTYSFSLLLCALCLCVVFCLAAYYCRY
jgi:hypothetical protein